MIFLSYAREDTERASRIYSLLSRSDRPVFYDKESLLPGMDWRLEIEDKLNTCSLILVLCTSNSIERAECMPDGHILIIPIRFNGVTIPKKLAKYQWIDINADVDYFNIQFFIDVIWSRIQQGITIDKHLLRENVVIFMTGKNVDNDDTYAYLQLPLWKLQDLKATMDAKENFRPSDFAIVLAAGKGEPPEDVRSKMASEYNLVDMPRPVSKEREEERDVYEQFAMGFSEAFKGIVGESVDLPLLSRHT